LQENDTRPDGRELGEFRQTILNVGLYLLWLSDRWPCPNNSTI